MDNSSTKNDAVSAHCTTEEFAADKLVKPQTVRKRYCLTGSYFGIVPIKLPNGRLSWPTASQNRSIPREGV